MDYENKYKEIVGLIKKAYLYAQTDSTKAVLEEIFPELKESEDEKVRKENVRFIQMEAEDEIVGNKWLAWLEKQGEQKVSYTTTVETGDGGINALVTRDIEIPFGAKESELQEATYYIPQGYYAKIESDKVVIKKGEQKTAWSEDDELVVKDIEEAITNYWHGYTQDILLDWLKPLKQRIGG